MEPVEPLSPTTRDVLRGYRASTPAAEREHDNWIAVQHKLAAADRPALAVAGEFTADPARDLDGDTGDDPAQTGAWIAARSRRRDLTRWITAAGASLAIAAAVLLLIRGTWTSVRALQRDDDARMHQAVDEHDARDGRGQWSAAPTAGRVEGAAAKPEAPAEPDAVPDEPSTPAPQRPKTPEAAPVSPSASQSPAGTDVSADTASPTAPASLAEQTRRLARARRAMSEERFDDALKLCRAYRQTFADGALLEEHMAIAATAQCRLGAQRDGAVTFLRAYPQSPHAERVRNACNVAH